MAMTDTVLGRRLQASRNSRCAKSVKPLGFLQVRWDTTEDDLAHALSGQPFDINHILPTSVLSHK
jgi:hypothetical protein